jgi:hypothetical protein
MILSVGKKLWNRQSIAAQAATPVVVRSATATS